MVMIASLGSSDVAFEKNRLKKSSSFHKINCRPTIPQNVQDKRLKKDNSNRPDPFPQEVPPVFIITDDY